MCLDQLILMCHSSQKQTQKQKKLYMLSFAVNMIRFQIWYHSWILFPTISEVPGCFIRANFLIDFNYIVRQTPRIGFSFIFFTHKKSSINKKKVEKRKKKARILFINLQMQSKIPTMEVIFWLKTASRSPAPTNESWHVRGKY